MNLSDIQSALREQKIDAWLFYDHHHRDPIAYRILGLPQSLHASRRWFYLIPADGEPRKLVHRIEAKHLDSLPGSKREYSSWQELWRELEELLRLVRSVAMQYSPNNLIPLVGLVDAGTVELIRSFGKTVVSSGDLVSMFEAAWSEQQIASHFEARDAIDRIMAEAFAEVGRRVRDGGTNELAIQRFIQEAFDREGLVAEDGPIVAVNENSGNPHYQPGVDRSSASREGDWLLLDVWGKTKSADAAYYDITWVGFVGQSPSPRHREIFGIVRDARNAGVKMVQSAIEAKRAICGWEVDDAVRSVITRAGHGERFTHRTGHSIGTSTHGNGTNMDNLETKDERLILPNTCFSIEPGIYLPEFGVRSEVNILVRGESAQVTGRQQEQIVLI